MAKIYFKVILIPSLTLGITIQRVVLLLYDVLIEVASPLTISPVSPDQNNKEHRNKFVVNLRTIFIIKNIGNIGIFSLMRTAVSTIKIQDTITMIS